MQTLFDSFETKEALPQDTRLPAKKAFLFCDGGSRGNPGKSAGAAVLYDEAKKIIETDTHYSSHQTNNYAEYMGVIIGIELAIKHNITDLLITLDSKLIVEQMNGNWKVKNANIKPLFQKAKSLTEQIKSVRFAHTLREGNKVADKLVNDELDKH